MKFVRWLAAFLENRIARVRFGDAFSKVRIMRQGLPQGSVLSPLLFLFFIDNLAKEMPEETINALFADDVSILATENTKEEAEERAQLTVNIVTEWSRQWKLDLNASKSEAAFFSTWTAEAKWSPKIRMFDNEFQRIFGEGAEFTFNKNPRLLGVILDRQLTFGPQVEKVTSEATSKMKLLMALSRTDWGWRKEGLKTLYTTFCRGKMMYAPAAWQPWLSKTQVEKLEVTQNKALRLITGQLQSTPVEALRLEADVCSMATLIKRECAKSVEKALRLPPDHPRRATWENAMPRRSRKSWKSSGIALLTSLPEEMSDRGRLKFFIAPPWQEGNHVRVFPYLPGLASRSEDETTRRQAAILRLSEIDADVTIYTDGSADAGFTRGGAAVVVTRGDPREPRIEHVIRSKGAPYTSSYEEEKQAMTDAAQWIQANVAQEESVAIATDSQSLCMALEGHGTNVHDVWCELRRCAANITIQWIPGHSNIPGNEAADEHAKGATELEGRSRSVSYQSACTMVKKTFIDDPPTHVRTRKVYSMLSKKKERTIDNRRDQVMLARIRSGHHMGFAEYRHRVDGKTNPTCNRCDDANDSVEHWLACDGTEAARANLFESCDVDLSILTDKPQECITLARRTLRDVERG